MAFGLVQLTRIGATSLLQEIIVPLIVGGLGQGLFLSPNSNALLGATPRAEQGQASGVLATRRIVGQSLSVAVAGAILASLGGAAAGMSLISFRGHLSGADLVATQETFLTALHTAFLVCAAFVTHGVLTALLRGSEPAVSGSGGLAPVSIGK